MLAKGRGSRRMQEKVKDAIAQDDSIKLQWLLSQEAEQPEEQTSYVPPLHRAIFHGMTNCVRVLIQMGADVNMLIPYQGTDIWAADFAANMGSASSLRLLLEAGATCSMKANDRGLLPIARIYDAFRRRATRARSAAATLLSSRVQQRTGLPRDVARLVAHCVWSTRRDECWE